MWQRFTERARRIILLGQEEAGKMNSGHVGTEHLLLGLVRENEGVAAQVLQKMGVSLSKVRQEIEAEVRVSLDEPPLGEPKLTPKAKRVLELAADEARRMRHNYIGTEHLLLALLREKDGLAATILRRLGLNLEKAREEVLGYLGPDAPKSLEAPAPRKPAPAASTGLPFEQNMRRTRPRLWSRLDKGAQGALMLSCEEARARGYADVRAEHLLLGVLHASAEAGAQVLNGMGVSMARVNERINQTVPLGNDRIEGKPKFAPHAIPILQRAASEATRLGQERIGTRHLLIGLLQEGGTAAQIVREVFAQAQQLRLQVVELLEAVPQSNEPTAPEPPEADFDPFELESTETQANPFQSSELAPETLHILAMAKDEARQLGHAAVAPEHLLIALLRAPNTTLAGAMLEAVGLDADAVRAHIASKVRNAPPDENASDAPHGETPHGDALDSD